jgi:hypothetical protein
MRVDLDVDGQGLLWMACSIAGRSLRALVDTGANASFIQRDLANKLELTLLTETFHYAGDPHEYGHWEAEFVLPGATIKMKLAEYQRGRHGTPLIIGADLLLQSVLIFDGRARTACLYLW